MSERQKILTFGALLILLFMIVLWLSSCYTPKKARMQFGKAVSTFPIIGAEFCFDKYPCDTTGVTRDTLLTLDTIYVEPEVEVYSDTVRVNDTVRIVRTVQSPSRVITRTVSIRDTVKLKDNAQLGICNEERKQALGLAQKEQAERKQQQGYKVKWRTAAIISMALIGLWLFLFIRRKVKK